MQIKNLGQAKFPSPLNRAVSEGGRVPAHILRESAPQDGEELLFERAGPRAKLYFNPRETTAGIVTCGGLCPGINNVIRSLFLELHHFYGLKEVLGFRGGYQGLDPERGQEPLRLSCEL